MWKHVWVAGTVKLHDLSLTRAVPERFRDEYRTHHKALYKCRAILISFHSFSTRRKLVPFGLSFWGV